jgi:hypothetical protein
MPADQTATGPRMLGTAARSRTPAGATPTPVAELEAGFAPNEVALALTLTPGGAEYWMDLAVSLAHTIAHRLGGPTCPCNLSPTCKP